MNPEAFKNMTPEERDAFFKHAHIAGARQSILDFGTYVEPGYRESPFHAAVSKFVDDWVEHETNKLILVAPPQHGKSQIVSRFLPAYCLGKYPDKRVLHISYSKEAVTRMSLDVKNYMKSPAYQDVFPDSIIADAKRDGKVVQQNQFHIRERKGSYYSVGVGGALTSMSGNYIIVDDPIKDEEEARSARYRNRLIHWWTKTLLKRRNPPWSLLVMATRWHVADLTGWLLENEQDDWTVAHFPRVQCDTGEPRLYDIREANQMLWPERELLADQYTDGMRPTKVRKFYISRDELEVKDRAMYDADYKLAPRDTTCIEQGLPTQSEGNIFKAAWFWRDSDSDRNEEISRYDSISELEQMYPHLQPFQSWDFSAGSTSKNASYVVGNVFAYTPDNKIVLYPYEERGQWSNPDMSAAVRRLTSRCPGALAKVVENKASGKATVQWLEKDIAGFELFNPVGSKEERAEVAAGVFETAHFVIPSRSCWPGVDEWIDELLAFPSEPNDRVDTVSQAVIRMRKSPAQNWLGRA